MILLFLIALLTASPAAAQTGLLFDDVYLKHISGNTGHPERSERVTAIQVKTLQGKVSGTKFDSQAGTWVINMNKSQFPSGRAPKRQVTSIQAIPGGVKNVTDIVDAEGKTIHYEFTARYDGKDYPVTGDPVRDSVSIKKVDDYNFDVTNRKAGKIVNTVRASYARDGKSRTMTTTTVNARGERTTTSTVWDRQ